MDVGRDGDRRAVETNAGSRYWSNLLALLSVKGQTNLDDPFDELDEWEDVEWGIF